MRLIYSVFLDCFAIARNDGKARYRKTFTSLRPRGTKREAIQKSLIFKMFYCI